MQTAKSGAVLESKQYLDLRNARRGPRPRVQKQSARILAVCWKPFRAPYSRVLLERRALARALAATPADLASNEGAAHRFFDYS